MPAAPKSKGRSATSKARTASQKRAAAKPTAAKVKSNGDGPSKRELAQKRDLELAPKVKAMRDANKSWAEVKEQLGIDQPKGQVLIKMANVKPKDRIKLTGEDEHDSITVVGARDEDELSWADIAVRAGITMGKVKALYALSGADPAESRVGRAEPKAKPKAKPAAKKPAAKKAAPKGKAAPAAKGRKRAAKADPSTQG